MDYQQAVETSPPKRTFVMLGTVYIRPESVAAVIPEHRVQDSTLLYLTGVQNAVRIPMAIGDVILKLETLS